ncbi:MAG: MlaA family lipoprotein [Candidatus Rokuibacteriota bacterium]
MIRKRTGINPRAAASEEEGFVVLPRILIGCLRVAAALLTATIAGMALAGCGSVSGAIEIESSLLTVPQDLASRAAPSDAAEPPSGPDEPSAAAEPSAAVFLTGDGDGAAEILIAQTQTTVQDTAEPGSLPGDEEDHDPWERFNEKMFEFNRQTDRFVLKPVAQVYSLILPDPFQVMIANGFDNISFVPRLVNSLLQAKWGGATRELSRFVINSTAGIGGLFDAAKYWGIEKSREDFGQTLGVWGVTTGPFLVVPFMEPMTVRDGIGRGVDSLMNPLSYFIPFIWIGLSLRLAEIVNDRALNLDLFQGLEESVVDLYSAVRHGYLRRREQMIKE